MRRILFCLFLTLATLPGVARAQPEDDGRIHGVIAVGPGIIPDYDGANSYRIIPFAVATVQRGGFSFELRGLGGRADLIPNDRIAVGPAFNIRLPRHHDGSAVDLLDHIDTAVEAGGFVGARLGGNGQGQGRVSIDLTALADVSGVHDGFVASLGIAYAAARAERFLLTLDAQATYGSAGYQRTYLGITPEESRRSGLAAYRPGASLHDVAAGATFGYQFNTRWGLLARVSYSYLVGDAADSPIVREEGSRHQGLAGLALSYRF
jgi:outer membrane protein